MSILRHSGGTDFETTVIYTIQWSFHNFSEFSHLVIDSCQYKQALNKIIKLSISRFHFTFIFSVRMCRNTVEATRYGYLYIGKHEKSINQAFALCMEIVALLYRYEGDPTLITCEETFKPHIHVTNHPPHETKLWYQIKQIQSTSRVNHTQSNSHAHA